LLPGTGAPIEEAAAFSDTALSILIVLQSTAKSSKLCGQVPPRAKFPSARAN
jgi:hypothetical protein